MSPSKFDAAELKPTVRLTKHRTISPHAIIVDLIFYPEILQRIGDESIVLDDIMNGLKYNPFKAILLNHALRTGTFLHREDDGE